MDKNYQIFLLDLKNSRRLGFCRKPLLAAVPLFLLFFRTAMVTCSATARAGRQGIVFNQLEVDDG
jgi:hypothetical protein